MLFDGDAPQAAVVAPNLLTQVCSRIPTNIAATKIRTAGAPEASEVSAGPGQKPPRPQPAPPCNGWELLAWLSLELRAFGYEPFPI